MLILILILIPFYAMLVTVRDYIASILVVIEYIECIYYFFQVGGWVGPVGLAR